MHRRRAHSSTRALIFGALAMSGAACGAPDPTDTGSGSSSSNGASSTGSSGSALTGQRLYLAERTATETAFAASLVPFDVAEDGSLVPVSGAPFPFGSVGPGHNLMHAAVCRGFLYVATDDHGAGAMSILGFEIADSGAPVFISANSAPRAKYLECAEDKFIYAISDTSILAYAVLPDGTLESTTGHVPVETLGMPSRLQARGGHLFAFAESYDEVRVYGLDGASGALSHPPVGPSWPQTLYLLHGSASPDGKWFASTDISSNRNVLHLSSVGADGALAVVPPAEIVDPADPLLEEVWWVGSHLLVMSHSPTQIRSYDVSADGAVTIPAVSVLELDLHGVADIVVDAVRSRAFLLMSTADVTPEFAIVAVDVSPSGELTVAPGSPQALGPRAGLQLFLH